MRKISYAAVAVLACAGLPAAAVTLVGQTFDASYEFPAIGTVYGQASLTPSTFDVGASVESILNIEGVTFVYIDFAASSLRLDFNTILSNPTLNSTSFNGLVFVSANALGISGATINAATNLAGFDASRVTYGGGTITVNLAGVSYDTNSVLGIDFTTVPEPGSWALMIVGFGIVGSALRTGRVAKAVAVA